MPPLLSSSRFFMTTCPVVGGERVSPNQQFGTGNWHAIRSAPQRAFAQRRPTAAAGGEPPSPNRAKSLFRVGKNSRGNWVVQDQTGLCGGMFVNRAEALKFAMFENGNRPQ